MQHDVVPNVRAFGPLPEGWRHDKKITKPSGRGNGVVLVQVLSSGSSKHLIVVVIVVGVVVVVINGSSSSSSDGGSSSN